MDCSNIDSKPQSQKLAYKETRYSFRNRSKLDPNEIPESWKSIQQSIITNCMEKNADKKGRDKPVKNTIKRDKPVKSAIEIEEKDKPVESSIKRKRGKPSKNAINIERDSPVKDSIKKKKGRPVKHLFHKLEDVLQHSYYSIKKVQTNDQDFICMNCGLKVSAYINLLDHFNTIVHRENVSERNSVNVNDIMRSFPTEGKSIISYCQFTTFQSPVEKVINFEAPVQHFFVILTLITNQEERIYMCPYCSYNCTIINVLGNHFKSKSHLVKSKRSQKWSLEIMFSLCMEKIFERCDVRNKYHADIYLNYGGFDHYCVGTLSASPIKGKINNKHNCGISTLNALNTKSNVKIETTEYVSASFLSQNTINVKKETNIECNLLIPEIIFHEYEQISINKIEMPEYSSFSEDNENNGYIDGLYAVEADASTQHISTCENKYSNGKNLLKKKYYISQKSEKFSNNETLKNGSYKEFKSKGRYKTGKSNNIIKSKVLKNNEDSLKKKTKEIFGNRKNRTKTLRTHITELKKGLKNLEKTAKTFSNKKFLLKKKDDLPKKSECIDENVKNETSDIKLVHEFICARCGMKSDCVDIMKDHEDLCLELNKTPKIPLTAWYWDSFAMCKCEICHISNMNKNAHLLHSHNHQSALTYMQELDLETDYRPISNNINHRKFNCHICKAYTSKFSSNLAHHIYKLHRDTFIFKCDYCYFATMNLCILNDHMQYIHTLSSTIIYTPYFF